MKPQFVFIVVVFFCVGLVRLSMAQSINHSTWTTGSPIPTGVAAAASGVVDGEIYVVGGWDNKNDLTAGTQVYNPATNSWSSGVSLPVAMGDGAAAVVKNVLYVIGGWNGDNCTNAVWAYNQKKMTWSARAPMPTARCSIAAAVVDNIIYVIGGYLPEDQRLNTVESYDPQSDTWTEEAPLLVGKSEISVGVFGNKSEGFTIVAADGQTPAPVGDNGDNEAYSVLENTWTSLTSDPEPRNEGCAGTIGGKLYIAGGNDNGTLLDLTDSFQLATNEWTTKTSIPQAATNAASAVHDGLLYCIGGNNLSFASAGTVYNYVQIYRP